MLALLSVSIFAAELIIMFVLQHSELHSPIVVSVIDASLLTLILFPVLFFFVFRNLIKQNKILNAAQSALHASHVNLEERVEERTSEIQLLNERLKEKNECFDAALANMSQGLCMFDGDQHLVVFNERYASIYGLSSEITRPGTTLRQILDDRIAKGIFGEADPEEYINERIAWVTNRNRSSKIQHLSDGRSIQITHQPMSDGGWLDTHEDVTDITKAQLIVQRQKEELDQILRNVPRAVITTDGAGIIRTFNPAAELTFGHTAAEAIGRNVSLLMPEQDRNSHDRYIRSYVDTGVSKFIDVGPRRLTGRHKDGTEFPMELALGVVGLGEQAGFIGVAKDISEELKAETRLIEHRDLLQKEVDLATAELKTKAEELEHSLVKEKMLNEQQRQFISTASHEFRTPLAIIDTSVQRMLRHKGHIAPNDLEARGKKIRSAVKTMTALMESTLSAARMDAGKLEIQVAECDLRGIVLDICVRQLELNEEQRIVCDLKDLPDGIAGDGALLDQVFTNLLSNSVKYSPDGPDITVRGWREGKDALVSIADRGIGLDEQDLPRLFERFFRAQTSMGIPGTGIGLALVKTLVELHGGSISVESKKGEGSTFTVRLPIAGPPVPEFEQEPKQGQIITSAA